MDKNHTTHTEQSAEERPNSVQRPDWDTQREIRIADILFSIKKHIVLIIVCVLLGLAVGITLSVVSYLKGEINKQYAITADIAVTSQNENGLFTAQSKDPSSGDIYLAEEMVDSVIFVLKSDITLNTAIDNMNLFGITTRDIANNLSMSQYGDTQVIQITLYWRSAQEGVEILNAITKVAPDVLVKTLKIGSVSVINEPSAKYLIGGNIRFSTWIYTMLIGLAIGLLFAFLELMVRPTLLYSRDVKKYFGIEVLAEIPNRKEFFRKKKNLMEETAADDNSADVVDNYISLAQIVKTKFEEKPHTCVYVTSAAQNEGKTTVTSRLGVQLAELGLKVLLIDFDTKNPKLGGLFLKKVEYVQSINALYRGHASKEEAIVHLSANLDLLPAILEKRPLPYDYALLSMVEDLKQNYDMILLDTAPIGLAADTMSLNRLADVALMVIRFDGASLTSIRDAIERVERSKMEIIGCVVNCVRTLVGMKKSGYGYGYGYGRYSYGRYGKPGTKSSHTHRKTEQEKQWDAWEKEHINPTEEETEELEEETPLAETAEAEEALATVSGEKE